MRYFIFIILSIVRVQKYYYTNKTTFDIYQKIIEDSVRPEENERKLCPFFIVEFAAVTKEKNIHNISILQDE